MTDRRIVAAAIVLSAVVAGCRGSHPPAESSAPDQGARPPTVAATDTSPDVGELVQIEMRNVRLHMAEGIVLDVKTLRGEMLSTVRGRPPIFDDPGSYTLRLFQADVAMDMASLSNLMNHHVFAGKDPPLTDIEMEIDEGRLKQKAKLHKGIVLPISMVATVSASRDGRMLLKTEKVSTLGVPTKGLLDLFGIELADLVKLKEQRGIEIADNDVILAPGRLLPPPQMDGHLARVEIAGNRLHQVFSNGKPAPPLARTDAASPNYLYFSGSVLRFGKLTMTGADLRLIDSDPDDPFDFFPARYQQQLIAGYSKNTPQGGLKTYMPDFNDLGRVRDLKPR
jgi:hypothetical protein